MNKENEVETNIFVKIKKYKKVIIWGSAFLGKCVAKELIEKKITNITFWDKKVKASNTITINGEQFYINRPYTYKFEEDTLIIVCIGNNVIRQELLNELESNGYVNLLSQEEHRELFISSLKNNKISIKNDENLDKLSNVERLEKAIEFAIKSKYVVYDMQNIAREQTRVAKELCLYGVDEYIGSDFFENYCKNNGLNNVKYLCDNKCENWGKTFNGLKCISIEELSRLKDCTVIILNCNYKEIKRELNERKISNFSINELELNVFDDKYTENFFINEKKNILETINLFSDEVSKEIYVETICNRIAPQYAKKDYVDLYTPGEYFNHGLFKLSDEECFVDAGAYIGDSFEEFIKTVNNKFEYSYLFELDDINFNELKEKIKLLNFDNVKLINKGVYNENKLIEYGGNCGGANITSDTGRFAEVTKIDDELSNKKVTYIKMDIEGSEMAALEGTKKIICKWHPKLAISVYHHLSDIWKIPMYINFISKSKYEIKLRHHSQRVWDTDCYFY